MARPLALPALLLWLSAGAAAQDNMSPLPGPGTATPHGRTCGLPATTKLDGYKDFVASTYRDVLNLAQQYYADPRNPRAVDEALPDPIVFKSDGPGMAAHAEAPNVIVLKPELCGEFGDAHQVAWVIGHELAHLAMKHGEKRMARRAQLETECAGAGDDKAKEKCANEGVGLVSKPQESAADARSIDYLRLSHGVYDINKALTTTEVIQDLYWVDGKDGGMRPYHPTARQRRVELGDKIKSLEKSAAALR